MDNYDEGYLRISEETVLREYWANSSLRLNIYQDISD